MSFRKILYPISTITFVLWFFWMLTGCSEPAPLGGLIDKQTSGDYFWGWNKKKIYFKESKRMKGIRYNCYYDLEDADAGSFKVLQDNLATDTNYIYYGATRQDQLDRSSFYLNRYGSVCDKEGVYTTHFNLFNSKKQHYFKPVEGADPQSFRLIEPKIYATLRNYYFAQDDKTVFVTRHNEYTPTEMDSPTFRILNQYYGLDKDYIYFFQNDSIDATPFDDGKPVTIGPYLWNGSMIYTMDENRERWKMIPVENPSTIVPEFEVEKQDWKKKNNMPYLWVDGALYLWDELYHHGSLDMVTLTNYRYDGYYKDKDHVYYREAMTGEKKERTPGRLIPEADSETFGPMRAGVFRDKNNVYIQGIVISGVDPDTFREMDDMSGIFLDKDHVYASDNGRLVVMEDIDPATFEVVERWGYICRDKRHVYLYVSGSKLLKTVPEIDGASFKQLPSIPDVYADKDYVYYYNKTELVKVEGADPGSFEQVGEPGGIYKDKARVYFRHNNERIVIKEIADAASFRPLKSHKGLYEDKQHLFFYDYEFLAWVKGGMHMSSIRCNPEYGSLFDKYGYFKAGENGDGEREPHPFGEIGFKMILDNAKEVIKENRRNKQEEK